MTHRVSCASNGVSLRCSRGILLVRTLSILLPLATNDHSCKRTQHETVDITIQRPVNWSIERTNVGYVVAPSDTTYAVAIG